MGYSPCLGDLPDPGIEPGSPVLQGDSLLSESEHDEEHDETEILETINSANLSLLLVAAFTVVCEKISLS